MGPVHVHPQQSTVSQDLLMAGQTLAAIPGLFQEAASAHDAAQPLKEEIVDKFIFSLGGMMALASSPMLIAGSAIAYVGEKLFATIDSLPGMAKKVEEFGYSLDEQEKIIAKFGPLLELPGRIAEVAKKTEQKTEEVKKSTKELDELAAHYPQHADLLVRVGDTLTRLETVVIPRISAQNINGMQAKAFAARVTVLQQIAKEERQMTLLAARLDSVITRISEKDAEFEKIEAKMAASAQAKGAHIDALQSEADLLTAQEQLIQKTTNQRPADVLVSQLTA
jgi:hypothetical protein